MSHFSCDYSLFEKLSRLKQQIILKPCAMGFSLKGLAVTLLKGSVLGPGIGQSSLSRLREQCAHGRRDGRGKECIAWPTLILGNVARDLVTPHGLPHRGYSLFFKNKCIVSKLNPFPKDGQN